MTATYRELLAVRRPNADHRDLPTAILPTAIRRPTTAPTPTRPAGYTGEHRRGTR
ncbi:hypothetical protein [Micromonospora sp. RTGN7]|uniref:hypothetical protein n=1 Tax=Micromonospora sp. RTGN7 TaxID=3016526 RepID=UPI0029FEF437|nr:hypothetical protein [Micromonospora sp. RTGN7]